MSDSPSSLYTVLQPPVSDPVQLGGDTTLQCSILTDNSAGDHSVYWFRHGSGESDPGIIFTHGNRSDQCKKSSETVSPTQSCIYKLPKNNLSLSDAGTYYCAVAACGHIIFGNGTKLDLTGGGASKINISCLNGKKYVQNGENSCIYKLPKNNLSLSDAGTYYCAVAACGHIIFGNGTKLDLTGESPSSLYTVLQPPVSDPVQLGGDTTLQCSILTDNSAGDHSVYWFRHGSGESDPGIIFTHGNRSDQCKKSSETVSPTQSCIYKLPKNNLSLSDAGTYYCAVAACGHIFFGDGTKLDLTGENSDLDPTIIALATSNILSVVVILFLCKKVHNSHHKVVKDAAEGQAQVHKTGETGDLNYAALSFTQPPSSRRSRTNNSSDQPVYSQVKSHQ
ncbi:uncharacterized protein LOC111190124 [Astyanax mexicanus]|uniref:uncharacterized protein LOC111190124 n=1 Tax=Astyanax mexicanus TaxID=7994 RepID=UPI0020CADB12|nr:uncharacterized protein LOC111190124 [Astyanax mexicanus]